MPLAHLFDFRHPLPLPAAATGLVAAVGEAAPRVGLLLGVTAGRELSVRCTAVRRVALVEVATSGAVWAPLTCGLPDAGLLLVPADSAVAVADLLLGGPGEGESRPATALEQQLLVQHVVPALKPLADALSEQGVTTFRPGAVSDRPLPVGGGEVVAIALELLLPSAQTAVVTICLPAKSLLPADTDPVATTPTTAAARVLADVPVELSLRLAAESVSASEVEDLRPGDVIRLEAEAFSTLLGVVPGHAEDLAVLTASLGRRGKRRAVVVGTPYGGQ